MILDRLPPHDIEAEEACIAAALVDNDVIPEMMTRLRADRFFREKNSWAWDAICEVWMRGEQANVITVNNILAQRNQLEDLGGNTYLTTLVRELPTAIGATYYADIVARTALQREIIDVASHVQREAWEATGDPVEAIEPWMSRLLRAGEDRRRQSVATAEEIASRTDHIIEFLEEPRMVRGLRTPWESFDFATGGLRPTGWYIVSAGTSVGKSLFVQQIAMHNALTKHPVMFVTGEMSAEEAFDRMNWMRAGVDPENGRTRGFFRDDEKSAVLNARGELAEAQITFVEDMKLATIVAEARRLSSQGRCELLVIDHIQHVSAPGENRTTEIETITRELKTLVMREGIVGLGVSHENREGLAKGSSSIEQDANGVFMLRPVADAFAIGRPGEQGLVELTRQELIAWQAQHSYTDINVIIGKLRAGSKGSVLLRQHWPIGGRYVEVA